MIFSPLYDTLYIMRETWELPIYTKKKRHLNPFAQSLSCGFFEKIFHHFLGKISEKRQCPLPPPLPHPSQPLHSHVAPQVLLRTWNAFFNVSLLMFLLRLYLRYSIFYLFILFHFHFFCSCSSTTICLSGLILFVPIHRTVRLFVCLFCCGCLYLFIFLIPAIPTYRK